MSQLDLSSARFDAIIKSVSVDDFDLSVRKLWDSVDNPDMFRDVLRYIVVLSVARAYNDCVFAGDKLVSWVTTEELPITAARLLWVTEEAVMRDRTGLFLRQCEDIGRYLAYERELHILRLIQDTSKKNRLVFQSVQDIEDAIAACDSPPTTLFVPDSLAVSARMLIGAAFMDVGGESHLNPIQNKLDVVSSTLLDDDTTWYVGDFKKDYSWCGNNGVLVDDAPGDHPKMLTHNILCGFRISLGGECRKA